MKRVFVAATTFAAVLGLGAAMAAASGGPEIDNASATITLHKAELKATRCTGVKGIPYVTYRGSWGGTEHDTSPGSTPYDLSGPLSIGNVVWTINLRSGRGVLRGTTSLFSTDAAGAALTTYRGPLTLITQGLPGDSTANGMVSARGWINVATFTKNKADGGSLLANVELRISSSLAAAGEFGTTMNFPDYAVTYNNLTC